jgi:plastocyanin
MRAFLAAFLVLAFLSGCTGSTTTTSPSVSTAPSATTTPPAASTDHAVAIVDFQFMPDGITIKAGDSVTWTNSGGKPHSATSDASGGFDSGVLSPGDAPFKQSFPTVGTFHYHCSIHSSMTGIITVN